MWGVIVKGWPIALFQHEHDARHWARERFLDHEWTLARVAIDQWEITEEPVSKAG